MKTVKKSYKIKAGDILVIKPTSLKEIIYKWVLVLFAKKALLKAPKGTSTGIVVENAGKLQVITNYKNKFAVVPLSAFPDAEFVVPKNDYNKEERVKISEEILNNFDTYDAVEFEYKLKSIVNHFIGSIPYSLNEDFEEAINTVRPSTFYPISTLPFELEVVNSKYYVSIDKKHRRLSK